MNGTVETGRMASAMMKMSEDEFKMFSTYIYSRLGIKMPPAKKLMLSTRIGRRLRDLGMGSYREYYDYVFGAGTNDELVNMIDVVTTNKTEFFRESAHFTYLAREVLPELVTTKRFSVNSHMRVWCAGCSTGEEAYTLAFVMEDFFRKQKEWDYSILATDISSRVLEAASRATYRNAAINSVPVHMVRKYMMRGKGASEGLHRVVPEIRKKIHFRRLNFMDADYGIRQPMDVIFCRNVVIYFDRETQIEFFMKLYDCLAGGGFLFIGSSETLFGISNRFTQVGPTIYRKNR